MQITCLLGLGKTSPKVFKNNGSFEKMPTDVREREWRTPFFVRSLSHFELERGRKGLSVTSCGDLGQEAGD